MSVIKSLKIKQADGTFGEAINLGAKAENVILNNGDNLENYCSIPQVKFFNTFKDMESAAVSPGDIVLTNGFYIENDGGSSLYQIFTNEDNILAKREVSFTSGMTELKARIISEELHTNVKALGVYGDGIHNDTDKIIEILNLDDNLYFPNGTYLIKRIELGTDSEETMRTISILGEDMEKTIFKGYREGEETIYNISAIFYLTNMINISFKNLHFNGSILDTWNVDQKNDKYSYGIRCYRINAKSNIYLNNIIAENFGHTALAIGGCKQAKNIKIKNIGYYPNSYNKTGTGMTLSCRDNNLYEDIYIENCLLGGLYISNATQCNFNDITVKKCGGWEGFDTGYRTTNQFGIQISSSVSGSSFSNLKVIQNYKSGMILGGKRNTFNNIYFLSNGYYDPDSDSLKNGSHISCDQPRNTILSNIIFENENQAASSHFYAESVVMSKSGSSSDMGEGNIYNYKIVLRPPVNDSYIKSHPNLMTAGMDGETAGDAYNIYNGNSGQLDNKERKLNSSNFYNGITPDVITQIRKDVFKIEGTLTLAKELTVGQDMFFIPNATKCIFTTRVDTNTALTSQYIIRNTSTRKIYKIRIRKFEGTNIDNRMMEASETIPAGTYEIDISIPMYGNIEY